MAQIPQGCGRDYTNETDISRQHSAARRGNGGKPEDAPQQYRDVTTIRQTRCRAYIFPIVKTFPIDVSAHARI